MASSSAASTTRRVHIRTCTACALCVRCVRAACVLRVRRVCAACAPRVRRVYAARAPHVHVHVHSVSNRTLRGAPRDM